MKGGKLLKRLARKAGRFFGRVVRESWRRDRRALSDLSRTAAYWAGFDPPPVPAQLRKPIAKRYRTKPGKPSRGRVYVEAHTRQTARGAVRVAAHWRKK